MRPVLEAGLVGWRTVVTLGSAAGGWLLAALVFALIFKVMPRVHVM